MPVRKLETCFCLGSAAVTFARRNVPFHDGMSLLSCTACLMDLAANGYNRRLGQVSSTDLERGQRRGTRRQGVFDKGVYVVLNCLG